MLFVVCCTCLQICTGIGELYEKNMVNEREVILRISETDRSAFSVIVYVDIFVVMFEHSIN